MRFEHSKLYQEDLNHLSIMVALFVFFSSSFLAIGVSNFIPLTYLSFIGIVIAILWFIGSYFVLNANTKKYKILRENYTKLEERLRKKYKELGLKFIKI